MPTCVLPVSLSSSLQFDVWEDLSGKQTVFRMQGEREKEIERTDKQRSQRMQLCDVGQFFSTIFDAEHLHSRRLPA